MYAKWTLAPSGFYIGVVVFNNKHYYSYGRTANLWKVILKQDCIKWNECRKHKSIWNNR